MRELKRISPEGVSAALEKAMRYRLLNEPMEAESICIDVLQLEPKNRQALITLLLALTDQFDQNLSELLRRTKEVLERLDDPYTRFYYEGIVYERRAKAHLKKGSPGSGHYAFALLQKAIDLYEQAEPLSPKENDDAILRWNTCVRIIMNHPDVKPETGSRQRPIMLE